MAGWILYAHLDSINVKVGQTLKGEQNIGIIGDTGNAYGKHLHTGLVYSDVQPSIRSFDSVRYTTNPWNAMDKYGKTCHNDKTLDYYNTTEYPYSPSVPHAGVDFSGVIDKSYESKYAYNMPKSQTYVVYVTNNDKYYGKCVVVKIVGEYVKPTPPKEIKMTRPIITNFSFYNDTPSKEDLLTLEIKTDIQNLKVLFNKKDSKGKYTTAGGYSSGSSLVTSRSYSNGILKLTIKAGKFNIGEYIVSSTYNGIIKDCSVDSKISNDKTLEVYNRNDYLNFSIANNRFILEVTKQAK